MSDLRGDLNAQALDVRECARMLREAFDRLFAKQPPGEVRNELVALKCAVSGLMVECEKLHSLTGAARMVGMLPPRTITFTTSEPDGKTLAANDH